MAQRKQVNFEQIKEEMDKLFGNSEGFDRLKYFVEMRKLYKLLQALFTGGSQAVDGEHMSNVSIEVYEKHFNILVNMVLDVCKLALELQGAAIPKEEEEKEPEEEQVEEPIYREREIKYLI